MQCHKSSTFRFPEAILLLHAAVLQPLKTIKVDPVYRALEFGNIQIPFGGNNKTICNNNIELVLAAGLRNPLMRKSSVDILRAFNIVLILLLPLDPRPGRKPRQPANAPVSDSSSDTSFPELSP
jgi:hypothetical protein